MAPVHVFQRPRQELSHGNPLSVLIYLSSTCWVDLKMQSEAGCSWLCILTKVVPMSLCASVSVYSRNSVAYIHTGIHRRRSPSVELYGDLLCIKEWSSTFKIMSLCLCFFKWHIVRLFWLGLSGRVSWAVPGDSDPVDRSSYQGIICVPTWVLMGFPMRTDPGGCASSPHQRMSHSINRQG